jgi:hypothetical protein
VGIGVRHRFDVGGDIRQDGILHIRRDVLIFKFFEKIDLENFVVLELVV